MQGGIGDQSFEFVSEQRPPAKFSLFTLCTVGEGGTVVLVFFSLGGGH